MKKFLPLIALLLFIAKANAQTAGDYRSHQSGDWSTSSTWERFDGTSWITPATPPASADGSITIRSGHSIDVTTPTTADQILVNTGGGLNVASTLTLDDGAGTDLDINGTLTWTGTLTGTGTILVETGAGVNLGNGARSTAGTLNTTMTNNGNITWYNFNAYSVMADASFTVNGTLINNGIITVYSAGSDREDQSLGGSGTFINNGTLTRSYGSDFTLAVANYTNSATGNIITNSGQPFYISSPNSSTQSGTFTSNTSVGIEFSGSGTYTYTSSSQFNGAGLFTFSAGTHNLSGGYNAGSTKISGNSTVNFNQSGNVNFNYLNFESGTFGGSASRTMSGGMAWGGDGTINGSGTVTIPASATVNLGNGTFKTGILNGTMVNNGTINWNNFNPFSAFYVYPGFTINGTLTNNSNINISSSGYEHVFQTLGGSGTLNNNGTITRNNGYSSNYFPLAIGITTFNNSGALNFVTGFNDLQTAYTLGGTISVNGEFTGATLSFNGTTFTNNGNINNSGLTFTSNTSDQNLNGTGTINTLTLNCLAQVILGGTQTINTAMNLTQGLMRLNNNDLILGTSASLSGGSSASYFLTNGTGTFQRMVNPSTANLLFPVGTSIYRPATLSATSSHVAHYIKARVIDNLYDNYDASGNPTGVNIPGNVVKSTWLLNDVSAGADNLFVKLQWDAPDQGNFDRTKTRLGQFSGGVWNLGLQSLALGSGPYTFSSGGITSLGVFGILNQFVTCTGNYGPVCKGTGFSLPYTVTGTYSGNNVFTAQLTDVGNTFFENIGTKIDNVSGSMFVNIPANFSTLSNHYRIRIISSSPYSESPDNQSDITISSLPVAFLVDGSGTYCPNTSGNTILLSNSQVGVNYQLYVDGSPTGAPQPGSGFQLLFPNQTALGTYTIVGTNAAPPFCATNMSGSATIIADAIEPVIVSCAPNKTVNTDAGQCTASNVLLGTPNATDNCGIASMTPDAPASFPIGETPVLWTITDYNGHSVYCAQFVTVTDAEAPAITCPSDINANTETGLCTATVANLGTPITADNCGIASVLKDYSSTVFPKGTTTINWTVTDIHNNTNTCTQHVIISDHEAPVLTGCPADITTGQSTASWINPIANDNCPGVNVTSNYNSGDVFPVGTTTVTYTATDAANNTANCSFNVTRYAGPTGVISGNQLICSGATATLNFTFVGAGPYTYTFTDGTNTFGPFSTNSTTDTRTVSPTANTTYTLASLSNIQGAGTFSGSAAVTVDAPTATLSSSGTCGNANTLSVTSSSSIQSVIWKLNGNPLSNVSNFNPTGTIVAGTGTAGAGLNQLSSPQGIFITPNGNLFVVDATNRRVMKYTPDATSGIKVAGGNGSGAGLNQLNGPSFVYADANDTVYVSDVANNRVMKWAPGATIGVVVAGGNGAGSASNQLSSPEGVTVDGAGNVYVVDGANYRVQKWERGATSGITVAGGNGSGAGANQLSGAAGNLCFDNAGNLLIADDNNRRIQRWVPGAASGTTAAATGSTLPFGIALAANGDIYYNDLYGKVFKYSPVSNSSVLVAGTGITGSGLNQLNQPFDVALDNAGNLYVSDKVNARVMKYAHLSNTIIRSTLSGTYTATITNSNGCAANSNSIFIDSLVAPSVTLAATQACPGGSATVTATPLYGGTAPTYQWSVAGVVVSGNNTATLTVNNVTATTAISCTMTSNYTCRSTTTATSAKSVTLKTVSMAPASITYTDFLGFPSTSTTSCAGLPFNITVNGGSLGTGATRHWYNGNCGGTVASSSTGATITIAPTTTTTYFCRYEGDCNNTNCAQFTCNVVPQPDATVTPSGTIKICPNSSIILSAQPGYSYQWFNGTTVINGATLQTLTVNAAGTYKVTVGNGVCSKTSAVVTVTMNPLPNANFTPTGNQTLCPGASISLAAPTGAATYQWSRNGSAIGGNTANLLAYQAGTYTLTVTSSATQGNCTAASSASAVLTGSATSAELLALAGNDQNLCDNFTNLQGNSPSAGITGTWNVLSGNVTLVNAHDPLSLVNFSPGTSLLTWQLSNGTCSGKPDTVALNMLGSGGVVITANGPLNFCSPGTVKFTANVCGSGWTYQWTKNGANIAGATASVYTAPFGTAQVYQVKATNAGIPYLSNTLKINAITAYINSAVAKICVGQTITAYVNSIVGASYQWMLGANNIVGATDTSFSITAAANGYKCKVTLPGGCFLTSNAFNIAANTGCSAKTDETEGVTEIISTKGKASMKLYPNPSSGNFFIELSDVDEAQPLDIDLYDINGKVVYSYHQLMLNNDNPFPIEQSNELPTGLYFLHVRSEGVNFEKKVMIAR